EGPVYDSTLSVWKFTMQDRINKVYLDIATEKNCDVLPVGFAHGEIRRYHPEYLLYNDYVHSNPTGGYIHGATVFSAITGINPVGLPNLYNLDIATLRALQCAAWKACLLDTLKPFILPWTKPISPSAIVFPRKIDTMECYLTRLQTAYAKFSNDSVSSPLKEVIFRSLTPTIATINPLGVLTTIKPGAARVEAEYYNLKDTLYLTVTPTSAVFDSIRITPHHTSGYISDGYSFRAVGYSWHQGQQIQIDFTAVANWYSGMPDAFDVILGRIQKKSASGGNTFIAIEKEGLVDTVRFTLLQNLSLLKRINFQTTDTVYNGFWNVEKGRPYTDSQGYGWVNVPAVRGLTASDNIKFYDSLFLTSSCLWASKNSSSMNDTLVEGTYKIKCNDGDYIVKMAVGHPLNNRSGYVRFGSDTLFKYTGINSARIGFKTDTLSVRGEQGLILNLYGPIAYLVVITKDGVNIDSVAFDKKPLPKPQNVNAENRIKGVEINSISANPNPFNPEISLQYDNVENSLEPCYLTITDCRGVIIYYSILTKRDNYKTKWSGIGYPSGLYVVQIKQGYKRLTKKITLLR
ncbi:MAG: hypothetical protein JNL74_24085, partial [Fibrobacteres bacterium]|nr:hypothetical protein [Fibrobacterota bacterium]